MSLLSFNHILNLSLASETRGKTGEVLHILDSGAAINKAFEVLAFHVSIDTSSAYPCLAACVI
jgi:hypothetical protein